MYSNIAEKKQTEKVLKKIYIEITNSCNFSCSFCFPSKRKKSFISVEKFREMVLKIKPFTDYIYLHVLGEPLLHPQLDELLTIAEENNLFVNITTNGSLLKQKQDVLKRHRIRLINISVHDIEENIPRNKSDEYFSDIFSVIKEISSRTIICLRLWNGKNEEVSTFNQYCINTIKERLNIHQDISPLKTHGNGIKLAENIFLQNENRFEWPDKNNELLSDDKICYALKDHIAILSDGTVVPCCLDADANLELGNIFTENLADILNKERAVKMKSGFQQKKAVEDFCKTCGFR